MAKFEFNSGNRRLSALSLFVPLLLVYLIVRAIAIFLTGFELSDVLIIRAVISDICIAAVVALLIALIPIRLVQFALGILVSILAAANVEHILANGANMDVAFSKYLADSTFLTGSVLTMNLALLVGLSIGVFCVGVVFLDKMPMSQTPALLKFKAPTLSVGILSVISAMLLFFIPITLVNASWTQVNFLEENVKTYLAENYGEKAGLANSADIEDLLYVQDLSGQSILPSSRKKNVVLVLIEGISQAHFSEGLMPWLEESRGNRYQVTKYISNQRQTNRGLYSVLCGRYPNLATKAAKTDIVNSFGTRYPCLPRILNDSGYRTVFMQSAELGFMRKDLFATAAGFDEFFGDKDYGPAHSRTDWGVDDLTLYENARTKMSELRTQDKPWFLTLLTSGTHQPYNNPDGPDTHEASITYADKAISKLLQWAAEDDLLKDTLFIVSSDEASTGTTLDIKNLISSNWAPFVVFDDQIDARGNESVFSHVDVPLSVLDYLSLPVPEHLYGRSIFRNYQTPRTIYFANVYTGLIFSLTGDREIIACNRSIKCSRYLTSADYFRYPLKDMAEVSIDSESIEFMRDVVNHSDQRYADFGDRPIFAMQEKEFSDHDFYTILSQFQVELKKGMKMSFEMDIANNLAETPGKLMTELIYYKCPGPVKREEKQLYIQENEVTKIRDFEVVADEDANFCAFLFIHSQTGARFKLESLNVTLSS